MYCQILHIKNLELGAGEGAKLGPVVFITIYNYQNWMGLDIKIWLLVKALKYWAKACCTCLTTQ